MKSKLKIEALAVDSFVVSDEVAERGTVNGNQIRPPLSFAPDQCVPTFAFSCGYPATQCPK